MPEYNSEHENVLNRMLKDVPGAEADKMFGYPVYKANGTMAVSVVANGIIARVGKDRAQKLMNQEGIKPYEPQPGRVWGDWVLMTGSFDKHKDVFKQAIEYTAAQPKTEKSSGRKRRSSKADADGGNGRKSRRKSS